MNKKQSAKISQYLLEWINYFDGNGLVIENDKPIKEALSLAESGGYPDLENIMRGLK